MPSPVRRSSMFFCERAFGGFFVLWGLALIADRFANVSLRGLFYGSLENYMPGWCWGVLLLTLGLSRWWAFHAQSRRWRVRLSGTTFVVMVAIASVAVWTGLWAATAPLAAFAAYVAFWCHTAMLRDLRLGL